MKDTNTKYPSNKNFGFFFSGIIFLLTGFFIYYERQTIVLLLFSFGLLSLAITLFRAELFFPLNKLWIKFGLLLGVLINPIILSTIYFGLITPYAIITRLFGRDELNLKKKNKKTYWILRSSDTPQVNFKRQF